MTVPERESLTPPADTAQDRTAAQSPAVGQPPTHPSDTALSGSAEIIPAPPFPLHQKDPVAAVCLQDDPQVIGPAMINIQRDIDVPYTAVGACDVNAGLDAVRVGGRYRHWVAVGEFVFHGDVLPYSRFGQTARIARLLTEWRAGLLVQE